MESSGGVKARRTVAGIALSLLAAVGLSRFSDETFVPGLRALSRVPSRLRAIGFAFDPEYGAFLFAVAAAVPPTSTVALEVPAGERYVYQAAYTLAPRRVLFGEQTPTEFLAVYRGEPRVGYRISWKMPNGVLLRR